MKKYLILVCGFLALVPMIFINVGVSSAVAPTSFCQSADQRIQAVMAKSDNDQRNKSGTLSVVDDKKLSDRRNAWLKDADARISKLERDSKGRAPQAIATFRTKFHQAVDNKRAAEKSLRKDYADQLGKFTAANQGAWLNSVKVRDQSLLAVAQDAKRACANKSDKDANIKNTYNSKVRAANLLFKKNTIGNPSVGADAMRTATANYESKQRQIQTEYIAEVKRAMSDLRRAFSM